MEGWNITYNAKTVTEMIHHNKEHFIKLKIYDCLVLRVIDQNVTVSVWDRPDKNITCSRADILNSDLNEIKKDAFEIPLTCGLRNRAGRNGWWFGRTINASYITFI